MKTILCLGVSLLLYGSLWLTGCSESATGVEYTEAVNAAGEIENEPAPTTEVAAPGSQEKVQEKEKSGKGLLGKASDLFDKAKSSGSESSELAKDWLGNKLKQASDGTSNTTEDSAQWAFDMYKSLKDKGLTQSATVKEWLSEDFQAMGAWEYKVQLIPLDGVEKKLNELGTDRWECFQVKDNTYFFKREKNSYLKAIPLRDLMRLVPLMATPDGE